MAVYYLDGTTGDDALDGTSRANACATLNSLLGKTGWSANDIIYIRPGRYFQSELNMTSNYADNLTLDVDKFYPGKVVFDFQKAASTLGDHYLRCGFSSTKWLNIHFTGMAAGKAAIKYTSVGNTAPVIKNCVFYNQGTIEGHGCRTDDSAFFKGCTFYNLSDGIVGWVNTRVEDCYFNSISNNPIPTNASVHDYNAYNGNTETNGIDTAVTDPGFTDAANDDFTLDSVTNNAAYLAYVRGGKQGYRIGATGGVAYLFDESFPTCKFFSPTPTIAEGNQTISWVNEGPNGTNEYTAGTPADVILVGSGLQIDLATTPAATGGRIRTPVLTLQSSGSPSFLTSTLGAIEDPAAGYAIDNNTSLPQTIEYRTSATSFLETDTLPAWNTLEKGVIVNSSDLYYQLRIELRTDHTGA
jgi:hypothetical protein